MPTDPKPCDRCGGEFLVLMPFGDRRMCRNCVREGVAALLNETAMLRTKVERLERELQQAAEERIGG